jgi:hypothetical protein
LIFSEANLRKYAIFAKAQELLNLDEANKLTCNYWARLIPVPRCGIIKAIHIARFSECSLNVLEGNLGAT